jgi:branched-chain amino acid transport system ATP-binding protein
LFSCSGLGINFGGHAAVSGVSAEFMPGTLTAIVGPNGAGKTTFFNLLSGQLRPTSGSVRFRGEDITRLGAARRARKGVGRAFQLTQLFPRLSVAENVRLCVQSRHRAGRNMIAVWRGRRDLIEEADRLLGEVDLLSRREDAASTLSHGEKRKLEVAMLMALDPEVLMFDEPTAGMSVDEVPLILSLIGHLKARADRIILLVEHKMDVIDSLADRIMVLHNGRLAAHGAPRDVMASAVVQEAYLGKRKPAGSAHG